MRSMTMMHPEIPQNLRTSFFFAAPALTRIGTLGGTYTAMGMAPVISHLKNLGVTAVEFLPVHHRVDEQHLVDKGSATSWMIISSSSFVLSRILYTVCTVES